MKLPFFNRTEKRSGDDIAIAILNAASTPSSSAHPALLGVSAACGAMWASILSSAALKASQNVGAALPPSVLRMMGFDLVLARDHDVGD